MATLSWSSPSQAKQIIPGRPVLSAARSEWLRDAYAPIEAESYDLGSGAQKNAADISSLDNGDWVRFAAVDFATGLASVQARLAVPASNSGGSIEFRADGVAGTLLGTLVIQTTGAYSTFYTQKVNLGGVSGVHDLYLVFRNQASMAVLDNLQFSKTRLTKIMALGDSITQGTSPYANYRYYLWQSLQTGGYNVDLVGSMTKFWNGTGRTPLLRFRSAERRPSRLHQRSGSFQRDRMGHGRPARCRPAAYRHQRHPQRCQRRHDRGQHQPDHR